MPADMYDLVIVAEDAAAFAGAFAEALLARDRRERVAVVVPRDTGTRRRYDYLDLSEIVLIKGEAVPEDAHYLEVGGRLVYGERIIRAQPASAGVP